MKMEQDSTCVGHKQCPKCAENGADNSRDNLAMYDDGHGYCFACGYHTGGGGHKAPIRAEGFASGKAMALKARQINEKTAKQFRYEQGTHHGTPVHIANYYRDGSVVAQHLRTADKKFSWIGDTRNLQLFGQHLWKHGGKRVVITEGEIDCMTVAQMMNNSWPVVSLPNGAASAVKCIKYNLDFLQGYDEIIIMFDMDEPGQEAAREVASVLPPGTAKIACLPLKDANECLLKGESKFITTAIWEAQQWSPDEILHVKDISEENTNELQVWRYPFSDMTQFMTGQRSGEIVNWTSGTGSGKSTLGRELVMHHLEEGRSVGMIMLEESPQETIDDLITIMTNQPVRMLKAEEIMRKLDPDGWDNSRQMDWDSYHRARSKLNDSDLVIYDHLGRSGVTNLLERVEYMAVAQGVDVILLDHITAAATGLLSTKEQDDERKLIDYIMSKLRELCTRTGVHIDIVSQLKKSSKNYEEGDRITLQDLKGAGSLGGVPNMVVALERNRQDPDDKMANTTTVRVLKNRLTGRAGVAAALYYDRNTGRMGQVPFALDDRGNLVLEP